jgi:hypothetical protein
MEKQEDGVRSEVPLGVCTEVSISGYPGIGFKSSYILDSKHAPPGRISQVQLIPGRALVSIFGRVGLNRGVEQMNRWTVDVALGPRRKSLR